MKDIILYFLALTALGFEVLKFFRIIPTKVLNKILLSFIFICVMCCAFMFDLFCQIRLLCIILAPFIAYMAYIVSLLIVGTKFNKENLMLKKVHFDSRLKKKMNETLFKNLLSSSVEEVVYRAIIQFALAKLIGDMYVSAIIVCVMFTASHYKKDIAIVQILDVLFFSILISILFAVLTDVIFTIIIHITRNTFVIIQKYIVQQKKAERFKYLINMNYKENSGVTHE